MASRPGPGGKISSIFNFVVVVGCAAAFVGITVGAVVGVGTGVCAAALVGMAVGKVVGVGAGVCAADGVGLAIGGAVGVGATGAAQDTIRIPPASASSENTR